jgi:hypothetical protein
MPKACSSTVALTVGAVTADSMPGRLTATATSADGQTWKIGLEFNENGLTKLGPGSFDLASELSYADCQHCVTAFQGDSLTTASKALFQNRGTMKLDTMTSPPSGVSKGALSNVEMRLVRVEDGTGALTDVDGPCFTIAAFSWDTTPPANKPCQAAEDCGDPMSVACDAKTGKCVVMQCDVDTNKGCTDKTICLGQQLGANYGTCYPRCTPFDTTDACASDSTCIPLDSDLSQGKCLKNGTASLGASCTDSPLSTGCAAGLVCAGPDDAKTCRAQCNYFDGPATCGAGQACVLGGYCESEKGDSAAIGSPCASTSDEGVNCGLDPKGAIYRGVCATSADGSSLDCLQACRVGNTYLDCDQDQGFKCRLTDSESALPVCVVEQ